MIIIVDQMGLYSTYISVLQDLYNSSLTKFKCIDFLFEANSMDSVYLCKQFFQTEVSLWNWVKNLSKYVTGIFHNITTFLPMTIFTSIDNIYYQMRYRL